VIGSKTRLPPAFAYRDFRLFWTGAVLSAIGSQLTTVAMAWQVYELTHSPFQVGLLGLGRAIPQIGFAIFGGLLADAMDRRRLMMAVQIMQCAVSAGLAVMTMAGVVSSQALFLGAVLFAFSSALETPIRQAVVPNLVPAADLRSAIALNTTQRSLASILGPSLAGVLLAVSGPEICYWLDALSWLAMLAGLTLIRRPLQLARAGQVSLDALLAGAKFVKGQQVIFSFMVLDFGATFFGSSAALLPVYAKEILHAGPVALGILFAAPSIGALAVAAAMSSALKIDRAGRWVLIGVAFYGICTMLFALSTTLWLSVLMLAGAGAGNMVSAILRGTSNQILTPDELRGRVAAVNSAFVNGGPQLGQFESGALAAATSVQFSALTGGLGALLLSGAIALLPKVRRFTLTSAAAPAVALATASG
jgi:MFS family permease